MKHYAVSEAKRTYHFVGDSVEYVNTTNLKVSGSGYHYLDYEDGKKTAIIAPYWLCIEIEGAVTVN